MGMIHCRHSIKNSSYGKINNYKNSQVQYISQKVLKHFLIGIFYLFVYISSYNSLKTLNNTDGNERYSSFFIKGSSDADGPEKSMEKKLDNFVEEYTYPYVGFRKKDFDEWFRKDSDLPIKYTENKCKHYKNRDLCLELSPLHKKPCMWCMLGKDADNNNKEKCLDFSSDHPNCEYVKKDGTVLKDQRKRNLLRLENQYN